ncbi:MAG: site-2 protease family protein [Candidatus Bathyarchaeota archaeon]|nr:site-2 protease family protein [Candidatus Bathyarchaeota archaeon]
MDSLTTLAVIIGVWFAFYAAVKLFKVQRDDLEVSPLYALYKSTRLNGFISRLASWHPKVWRVLGNAGVVASVGQAAFASYLLLNNLLKFFFKPETATPVQPLIPGVTISGSSLPWFMLAAGVVILTHELSHGIQCVIEGVRVKSAAVMVAVITFGGAVEPDEEDMNKSSLLSRMRIFASGSIVNLITGLLIIPIMILFNGVMPDALGLFFSWLYFVSINLAIMNMLPIGPLDGGQMWRAVTEKLPTGKLLQNVATYAFLAIIVGNIFFSFNLFGLVPI